MALHRCITLLLCLLLSVAAAAQNEENAILDIVGVNDTTLRVDFRAGHFTLYDTLGHTGIRAAGMSCRAANAGEPALLELSRLVVMPRGSVLQLRDWRGGEEVRLPIDGRPFPWQGATPKETERPWVPLGKEWGAQSGEWRVENMGVMGDRQVYRVTACPARYNPDDNSYLLIKSLTATLHVKTAAQIPPNHTQPTRMLIVSRPEFREGLQEYAQWKRHEGYAVEEVYAVSHKRDSVKALIRPYFDEATPLRPAPKYILLVGDAAKIQAFIGYSRPSSDFNTHSTDLYYAEYSGDWLPDAYIGRWAVNDTAELRAVVEKTLRYEQCRDMDTAMLRRAIVVAGNESRSPAPTTTNGQVNYVGSQIKQRHSEMDTVCYRNPASGGQVTEILADIELGAALLNYTAHCTRAGWSSPSVTYTSIDTLDNSQPVLYVNNCCLSNDFSGTCFGEQLLRKPQGGAIGVIGATNETLWEEDYYWAVGPKHPYTSMPTYDSLRRGAFDMLLDDDGITTCGELLQAGNMSVMASGTPYSRFYWEIYCLLGDPTLMPRLGLPRQQSLWVSDSVELGATELLVGCTPGATIAVTQGTRLLGAKKNDGQRSIMVTFDAVDDTMPLIVTATGPQMMPLTDTVRVTLPRGKAAMLHRIVTTDTAVDFSITNIGTDTLFSLNVMLAPDSVGATFMADTLRIDTMAPWASRDLHMSVSVTRWERWWSGMLKAVETAAQQEWQVTVAHWLRDTLPTLTFSMATADGEHIEAIEPHGDYTLTTNAVGPYDSIAVTVTALPTNDTLANASTLNSQLTIPDTIDQLHIEAGVWRGNYHKQYDYYLEAGSRTPRSDYILECYPWENGGAAQWTVDSNVSHNGTASLRSGAISYRQQTELAIEVLLPQADSVTFWVKTSSETDDRMTFEVDDVKKCERWGEFPWKRFAIALTEGKHTLRWRYRKDESIDQGSDCVWLDDIRLPLTSWDAPYGCPERGTTGIHSVDIPDCSTMLLYPNPADKKVSIMTRGNAAQTVVMTDIYGRTVEMLYSTDDGSVNLQGIPDGIYIMQIYTRQGEERHKLIIQHR